MSTDMGGGAEAWPSGDSSSLGGLWGQGSEAQWKPVQKRGCRKVRRGPEGAEEPLPGLGFGDWRPGESHAGCRDPEHWRVASGPSARLWRWCLRSALTRVFRCCLSVQRVRVSPGETLAVGLSPRAEVEGTGR